MRAALKRQTYMISRTKERDAHYLAALVMRVGIHKASVVAGILGVKKFQHNIRGETVSTASGPFG